MIIIFPHKQWKLQQKIKYFDKNHFFCNFKLKIKEFELYKEIQRLVGINEELNISYNILLQKFNEKNEFDDNETIESNKMIFFVLIIFFKLQ